MELIAKNFQRGTVLILALIAMVAMTLAAISLFRSVDSATLIAGNLAFRQSATSSGSSAIEAAAAWLETTATAGISTLTTDQTGSAYYATINAPAGQSDLTGNETASTADNFDWTKAKHLSVDGAGNTVDYVIHRMCTVIGPLDPSTCSASPKTAAGNSISTLTPMLTFQARMSGSYIGYYRVTVRTSGPRNTVSYLQAVILLDI